jgi:uncharacterized protein (TIGR03435 family)
MPEMDDIELLAQYARNHSEAAFATLVERHVNLVYSVALRNVGNPHAAEEITQAVFIILARKAAGWSQRMIPAGWLYQTTRLTAANFLRGEIRRQKREQEAYMQSLANEPEPEVWTQIAPLLDDALGRLGDRDRDAIVLRFFENKNLREVGAALGASEDAAKMRVSRALERLRKFFRKRGVSLTTTIIAGAISTSSVQAAPAALAKAVAAVAVAKGATAGGSTLTLIKGALKLMAWTKAKTAIVSGVVVLLAAGTTTITVKEIAARKAEASWRHPNPQPDRAPLQVEILPTKFPNSVEDLNVGSRGDNWVGVGQSVLEIARIAYGWRPGRILFTSDQPRERYDFISTLPQATGPALQAELKRKLGFVGHRETRDMDVLALKVRRSNAPGLQPPIDGRNDGSSRGHYFCDNSPLSSDSGWYPGITRFLEEYFKTPVIDQTELTQNFHIDLKWNERWGQDPDHAALKQALLDQLGLELVPGREPIEMLVMERVK